jgi:replicative DNA helicase
VRNDDHFAERALIGVMLQNARVIPGVRETLEVSEFLRESSRVVVRTIFELWDQGITPNLAAVGQHLCAAGDFDKAGGATYVASLTDCVPSTDDVSGLCRMVKKLAIDHRIAEEFERVRLSLEDGEQPSEVLAECIPRLTTLQQQATAGRNPRFELIHASELDQLPAAKFLPDSHIVEGGFHMWYGLSESGKSLYAMREAYRLARFGP